jgi:hypothetical protein
METIYGESLLRGLAQMADSGVWLGFWRAIAFLGSANFFALALPLLFAAAPARWALRLGSAFAISAGLTELLKASVDRLRPDVLALGLDVPLESAGAFENAAWPSGHTLMAVVLWGWIAWRTRHRAVRAALVLLIAMILFSRLALLRHDLLDVGGGLVIGAILLVALDAVDRLLVPSLGRLPAIEQAGLWLLGGVLLQLAAGLAVTALVLGVGVGLGCGAALASARPALPSRPGPARVVLRFLLGVVLVGLIRKAFDVETSPEAVLFVAYLFGGFGLSALIPLLTGGVWRGPQAQNG